MTVTDVVRFRHPLVRAAVYRAASSSERREAHQVVADLLVDYPDRRAWHLAATLVSPDEDVAASLEASALQSSRRGAYIEACRALERAAELTADSDARAHRLVRATEAAMQAGDAAWVRELAATVNESTDDPELLRLSAQLEAAALATTLDHEAARLALRHSIRISLSEDPLLALSALTTTALVAQFTGEESLRQEVIGLAAELDGSLTGHPVEAVPVVSAARLWVDSAVTPVGDREPLVARLRELLQVESTDPDETMLLGAAAMVLDETDAAIRLLTNAADRSRVRRTGYVSAATLAGLGWVCVERGRWDEALTIANEASQIAIAGRQAMHMLNADVVESTVAALRGDIRAAKAGVASVLSSFDPGVTTGITARAPAGVRVCRSGRRRPCAGIPRALAPVRTRRRPHPFPPLVVRAGRPGQLRSQVRFGRPGQDHRREGAASPVRHATATPAAAGRPGSRPAGRLRRLRGEVLPQRGRRVTTPRPVRAGPSQAGLR